MPWTYRTGKPCCACSGCHSGSDCEFTYEGGCGLQGGDAWSWVRKNRPELKEGSVEFDEACTRFLNQHPAG